MIMDRRAFLNTSALLAGATLLPTRLFAQAGSADAAANALFDQLFQEAVARSPELATQLGLDQGPLAGLKSQLSPRTAEERQKDLALTRAALQRLRALDRNALSDGNKLNVDVLVYSLQQQEVAPGRYGIDSVVRPYPIFQQGGAYFSVPDFLNSAHTIRNTADADAYLSRLEAFARALDEETEDQRAQAARGFLAPGWSLDLTLVQMRKLRSAAPEQSGMVQSLVTRAKAANVAGDWGPRATKIVAEKVYPALDRQIALIEQLRPTTRTGDGAWRLPQGEAIYAAALAQMTTTSMSPQEVHDMGLSQVAEISAQLDTILRGEGLTQGSVGTRLAQLNVRPDQLYPDTAEGRAALLQSLNEDVERFNAQMPRFFATLPTQPLEIRAVPVEIQDGASNGYYRRASLDGSRPAIYFVNLKDVKDWPKYTLPALSYHEGNPGHHLQISIAQTSKDIPMLRKLGGFSAYSEGWGLYAESVADEAGVYRTPLERAGFLQSYLFRATRLVVDTGLHAKRWTREKATDYMVETTGFARPRTQREVERYCTQIGQACSYKVGHGVWARLREEAERAGGSRFDVKQFHEVLKEGAMPLTILEKRVRDRMKVA
jgi:uncharacterized protein (DUF885 family)